MLKLLKLIFINLILLNNFVNIDCAIFNPSLPTAQITLFVKPTDPIKVQQLVVGRIHQLDQGSVLTASVTLIQDHGYYMIVDTPSATDLNAKEQMLRGLNSAKVYPGQIQLAVTTHGHPDHFSNGNFFPNSRHFFASYEYTGNNFIKNELYSSDEMKVTRNIELWNTPGHTNQDISAIVRNVPCCGTIGVVGDLFYSESDAVGNTTKDWISDAWNSELGMRYRAKVVCTVDWIIPGHGKMFKVTPSLRQMYNCTVPTPSPSTAATTIPPTTMPTTTTTIPSTTTIPTTTTQTIPTPSSSTLSPTPYLDINNGVSDVPSNQEFHDDMTIPPTTPKPIPNPLSYVTVDHWQNQQNNDQQIIPPPPQPQPCQPSYPMPILPQGMYAVQGGPPINQVPLSNHLAFVAPANPCQSYTVRHPQQPVPGSVILPMVESVASSFVSYLNAPQLQHLPHQPYHKRSDETLNYFNIIRRAFHKFTKSEPTAKVID